MTHLPEPFDLAVGGRLVLLARVLRDRRRDGAVEAAAQRAELLEADRRPLRDGELR